MTERFGENSQMTPIPQKCGAGLQGDLMLIPSGGLPGFASSSQEGLKAALPLCQALQAAIARVLLASPAARSPFLSWWDTTEAVPLECAGRAQQGIAPHLWP